MKAPILLFACLLAATADPSRSVAPTTDLPSEIVWSGSVGKVTFQHRLHVEDLGIACLECHHETRAAALDMPHPQYFEDFWISCSTCHRASAAARSAQKCSSCHPDSPSTVADETLSTKVVVHRSCWRCHEVGVGSDATATCVSCHDASALSATTQRAGGAPGNQP